MSENVAPLPDATLSLIFREGCVLATLDTRVYRLTAIQKAGYKLAERCTVVVCGVQGNAVGIKMLFARAIPEREAFELAGFYFQELLDQELREKVAEETNAIRALILANAFSRTTLIRRE